MKHIVVDDETARAIAEAPEGVEVRDRHGRHLGYLACGITDADIALAKKRLASDAPRYTTKQVLERLRSLENQ
jgi:hypothetical protein